MYAFYLSSFILLWDPKERQANCGSCIGIIGESNLIYLVEICAI